MKKIKLTPTNMANTAKYLYDISKLFIAGALITPVFTSGYNKYSLIFFVFLFIATIVLALRIDNIAEYLKEQENH